MQTRKSIQIWLIPALLAFAAGALAGESEFSGYMFGDYYWVQAHRDSAIEGSNGFWFRRIYFTYQQKIDKQFTIRLRLEMNSRGDFGTTSAALVPYIKDAYLKWKKDRTEVLLGISEAPTWRVLEKFWGYRSVEKTPLDLQRWGSSRDFGVAIRGKAARNDLFRYYFMLANGSGNKSEINRGKKLMATLGLHPGNFIFELYGDWNDNTGRRDFYTGQVFVGYKTRLFRVGLHYAHQLRQHPDAPDERLNLLSAFAVLKASEKVNLFARMDRNFDPNSRAARQAYLPFDPSVGNVFLLGGFEYVVYDRFQIMPNIEAIVYDKNDATGVTPKTDVVPRITFFYQF